ncbi:hypothetical protein BC835DRAFT_1432535, partial [Cytidiella melzeri]
DAKRPCCSTCARSHAYAVSHAVEGAVFPPQPDCTYDEAVPVFDPDAGNSVSRKMYEKMESRIHELEAQLREKEKAIHTLSIQNSRVSPTVVGSDVTNSSPPIGQYAPVPKFATPDSDLLPQPVPQEGPLYGQYTGPTGSSGSSSRYASFSSAPLDEIRSWPPNLPSPDVTRHLVESFFSFHMHATRLFHVPTFMASLDLLPTDPRFPHVSVLHAMCAVGSLYTGALPDNQLFNDTEDTPYEMQSGRWKKTHHRPDIIGDSTSRETFSEQQARYAKKSSDYGLVRAEFQCLQAQIILTWWYLSQGRYAFLSAAHAMRCTGPCSISTCYTTAAITHYKPPSVLPPAKSVIEDEIRRNTFWIAYSMERQQGTGNGWALSLDDLDVCQLLPLRGDQFEQGILVLPEGRQWSYAPDLLFKHPVDQTDSFILYVKSAILLSRVKTFNLRFRWRLYNPGETLLSPQSASFEPGRFDDATSSPEFYQLDHIITSFRPSFPARLRSPVENDVLDPYLYTACIASHLAQILLHEPHAKPDATSCPSATKTLMASRTIVELMYTLGATNYDITLLDLQVFMCWFMAGRVLVRFLRAVIDSGDHEQIVTLQGEISFVRMMLSKAGERVHLAFRYSKMLHDTLVNMCGEQFAETIPSTLPPREHYAANTMHTTVQHVVSRISV